jgi:hypothetical protein
MFPTQFGWLMTMQYPFDAAVLAGILPVFSSWRENGQGTVSHARKELSLVRSAQAGQYEPSRRTPHVTPWSLALRCWFAA